MSQWKGWIWHLLCLPVCGLVNKFCFSFFKANRKDTQIVLLIIDFCEGKENWLFQNVFVYLEGKRVFSLFFVHRNISCFEIFCLCVAVLAVRHTVCLTRNVMVFLFPCCCVWKKKDELWHWNSKRVKAALTSELTVFCFICCFVSCSILKAQMSVLPVFPPLFGVFIVHAAPSVRLCLSQRVMC